MRLLVLMLTLVLASGLKAQAVDSVEIDVKVGDTVEINACPAPFFKYLDYFRKTRWIGNEPAYDTATGEGFYKSFFSTGDFNAAELSADFSGKRFGILGMEVLSNKKTGEPMYILYLNGPEPNSIIWVDFYEALAEREIDIRPLSLHR